MTVHIEQKTTGDISRRKGETPLDSRELYRDNDELLKWTTMYSGSLSGPCTTIWKKSIDKRDRLNNIDS